VLVADHVSKTLGGVLVVDQVSLTVERSETVCIMGPSGGGKTTFIRCLNYLEKPDAGIVAIQGEILGYERRGDVLLELPDRLVARQRLQIGMVFQHFNLFQHKSVLENVIEAPIRVLRRERKAATEEGMQLLRDVGLADKARAMPSALSGGQQQRVAIARALAMKPAVMLFDEPTSSLDPELVGEVLDVIARLAAGGLTSVIVTHEIGFARRVADRVMLLEAGRVVEEGPVTAVLDNARHDRTREFFARIL
jgi:polar amino acid transport system ATP-binding protein